MFFAFLNFSCLKFLIRFPLLIYKALLIVILFRILCVLICIFQRPLYSSCSSSVTFQAVHESSRRLQSSLRFHCVMALSLLLVHKEDGNKQSDWLICVCKVGFPIFICGCKDVFGDYWCHSNSHVICHMIHNHTGPE